MAAQNWQQRSTQFAQSHNLIHGPNIHVLDALSELGEVAKELLVGSDYGQKALEIRSDLQGEVGDLLYSICLLAQSLDIDLDTALEQTLLKYEKRWQTKGKVSSS